MHLKSFSQALKNRKNQNFNTKTYDESKIHNEKILVSWLLSSSSAPIPSESIIITLIGFPSGVDPLIGVPHIQSPYLV